MTRLYSTVAFVSGGGLLKEEGEGVEHRITQMNTREFFNTYNSNLEFRIDMC